MLLLRIDAALYFANVNPVRARVCGSWSWARPATTSGLLRVQMLQQGQAREQGTVLAWSRGMAECSHCTAWVEHSASTA